MAIRKTITAEDTKTILLEMFRRVGLTKEDYDNFDFSAHEWFMKYIWTLEEQDDFCTWLGKFFVRKKYVGKGTYRGQDWGKYEAGKFILNYGWKNSLDIRDKR